MSLSLSARRARLLALRGAIDASGGGALHVYAGIQPAMGAAAPSAPLIIIALHATSFELHATEASMALIEVGYVAVGGTPTWARFVDGGGAAVMDLPAGLPGSAQPVIITDGEDPPALQMWVGGEVTANCTVTEPE